MRVSQHAIDKYIEITRLITNRTVKDRTLAEDRILDLFKHARKEDMHAGLVKRVIDNCFTDAVYYKNEEWRIVVCDSTIVTVERDVFGTVPPFDPHHSRKVKRRIRIYQKRTCKRKDKQCKPSR